MYLFIKWIHILSSIMLVGTGFGSAFYLFFANRSQSLAAQAVVSRLVVRADWWFTTPSIIIQPLSGFWLMHLLGWPLATPWIVLSLCCYVVATICWLPVVWLQIKMAKMAGIAHANGLTGVPDLYHQYQRCWEILGYPAFVAMLAVYYLMINKPVLWSA